MPMRNPPHPGNVSKAAEILEVRRAALSDEERSPRITVKRYVPA